MAAVGHALAGETEAGGACRCAAEDEEVGLLFATAIAPRDNVVSLQFGLDAATPLLWNNRIRFSWKVLPRQRCVEHKLLPNES